MPRANSIAPSQIPEDRGGDVGGGRGTVEGPELRREGRFRVRGRIPQEGVEMLGLFAWSGEYPAGTTISHEKGVCNVDSRKKFKQLNRLQSPP
jgi:hypothetical protein